jgi:hypothetical protein
LETKRQESRLVMMVMMTTLILICLLLGAVLGQRFKILVLVPGMAAVLPLVAAVGIVRADPYGQIAIAVIVAAVSLQLGYLAGIALRHLMVLLRATQINASSRSPRASAPRAVP